VREQLSSYFPIGTFRQIKPQRHGSIFKAVRPGERSRHVEVRVSLVDSIVSAVGAVTKQGVIENDRATPCCDVPAVRIWARNFERVTLLVGCAKVIDVLCKLV